MSRTAGDEPANAPILLTAGILFAALLGWKEGWAFGLGIVLAFGLGWLCAAETDAAAWGANCAANATSLRVFTAARSVGDVPQDLEGTR